MTTDTDRLEDATLRLARGVREEFMPAMSELHLDVQLPELSRNSSEGHTARCEVTMYVRRDGDIVDVIEFQVHRDGIPTATPQEFESWLRTTFEDVLRRQRGKRSTT